VSAPSDAELAAAVASLESGEASAGHRFRPPVRSAEGVRGDGQVAARDRDQLVAAAARDTLPAERELWRTAWQSRRSTLRQRCWRSGQSGPLATRAAARAAAPSPPYPSPAPPPSHALALRLARRVRPSDGLSGGSAGAGADAPIRDCFELRSMTSSSLIRRDAR